jgi:fibronectin type 3 domain-containing protein
MMGRNCRGERSGPPLAALPRDLRLAVWRWVWSAAFGLVLLTVPGTAQSVNRGPYLQMGTSTGVTVRWRTDVATDSRVQYGPSVGNLATTVDLDPLTTEHVVALSGLAADTTYYYSVGTTTQTLAGDEASYFFLTSPTPGTAKAARFWVLGDSGTADANAEAVRDAYLAFTGATRTDLWLMLGDNAYVSGTDSEYQAAVFDMYPTVLRQSPLWPTLGNHDGVSADSSDESGPYYDIFTLPAAGEAGGVASGTEAYYSFDYGNVHFICLESFDTDRSVNGAMMTWLDQDLLAVTQDWIIAFWHHPPYSKGSHDSDTEPSPMEMRQNALPILEAGGVDVVLSGHSHSYERSFLLDGHYGTSGTLNAPTMILDNGDGRPSGDGAYTKASAGPAAHEGAVYAVAGSSGKLSPGSLDHPAMFVSLSSLGSLVLDVNGERLDAKFLDTAGVALDEFTIVKNPGIAPAVPSGLVATDTLTAAVLDWDDNAEPDLAGYRVFRGTTPGGPYSRIDGVASTTLIATGATWLFDDTGTDLGTVWRDAGFDDSSWEPGGAAELGYGDGGEATVLSFGGDSENKHPTYYFRHSFSVVDPTSFSGLDVRLKRDDGAVVYLNGVELLRSNMPAGAISYGTFASTTLGQPTEDTFVELSVPADNLVTGTNVLAVEVHQGDPGSSDVSFDFELIGQPADLVAGSQYADNTALVDTPYFYVVAAVDNADQESGLSSEACTIVGTPPAPVGLVATPASATVDLDWTSAGACGVDRYNVYRSTSQGVPITVPLNLTPLSTNSYTDVSVTPQTTYYYVATAVDLELHESVASAEVSATPQSVDTTDPAISMVAVVNITTAEATITWETDEFADSLVDYGPTNSYGLSEFDPLLVLSHSVVLTSLAPETTYHYSVTSGDASANFSSSADQTFTTLAACENRAVQFDGVNDWVNIPNLTFPVDFTVEGWMSIAPGLNQYDVLFGRVGPGQSFNFLVAMRACTVLRTW